MKNFESQANLALPTKFARRHDLDWLRFIAIVILLFYHTGMLFNNWGWHIKNTETSTTFQYWMVWLHTWRMPLLLFISGAGTYMALGKRTPKQYAGERVKRLLIPLLVGIFIIVPPQIYFEHIDNYNGYIDFYPTVFDFVPYPQGSFSWHHLWFIAYLLVFSIIAIPLLTFLRSPRSENFRLRAYYTLSRPAFMLFMPAIIILITQLILRPFFPEQTHDLVHDWAYFMFYFSFFVFGMIAYSQNSLWDSVGKNRKYFLGSTVTLLIAFYTLYLHRLGIIQLPWSDQSNLIAYDVMAIFVGWFTVITVVAFGQHYLNKAHRWLNIINEGLYPFYILHQTVIITIGYYICQLPWSITAKFWTVSLLTLVICLALYIALVRPFNTMRLLFGMKPKKVVKTPAITGTQIIQEA